MKRHQRPIVRAIRSVWAIARRAGIEGPAHEVPGRGLLSTNKQVRRALVAAWLRGYKAGVKDGRASVLEDER